MLLSRSKDQLIITAEDTFDWMELFDGGIDNDITFEVDGDNLDDVVECKFEFIKDYIEEDDEVPNYEKFLGLVGTVTYKVTPDLPEV